jgi:hypothetical protein
MFGIVIVNADDNPFNRRYMVYGYWRNGGLNQIAQILQRGPYNWEV